MFKSKVLSSLLMVLISVSVFADKYNVSNELSEEEQKNLAKQLNEQMIPMNAYKQLNEIIDLHTQIIEKCPSTFEAQQSCWMLSNLFILKKEDHKSAIEVLEHLMKQYPDTRFKDNVRNRLLACYETVGDWEKVCAIYKELLKNEPNDKNEKTYIARASLYASALNKSGQKEEAKKWYQKIIDLDKGRNLLEARGAKRYLEENK